MIIVTAGKKYNDIDALACAVAYGELLEKEGKDVKVSLPGVWNRTILPEQMKQYELFREEIIPSSDDNFVFVDLSEEKHFAYFDSEKDDYTRILEIYDHHYGFEDYWKNILGERSHIERVGACATQIFEEYEKRSEITLMKKETAELLLCAIVQNTLDFTSPETRERDHVAYKKLLDLLCLTEEWKDHFLQKLTNSFGDNFEESLRSDTKVFEDFLDDKKLIFSQVEVPIAGEDLFIKNKKIIEIFFDKDRNSLYLLNLADMKNKKSIISSNSDELLLKLKEVLIDYHPVQYPGYLVTDIIQRKQILNKLSL